MTTLQLHPSVYHLEYELLLRESIERDSYSAVKLLLDFNDRYPMVQTGDVMTPYLNNADKWKKTSKGLIVAAQNGNFKFIRLFLSRNYRIEDPHGLECQCSLCMHDRLGQSKKRIEILKAITNPVYIGLTSDDPFLRSFELCKLCSRYGSQEDCFENVYNEIITECQRFCFELLDNIENDTEVQCVMSHGKSKRMKDNVNLKFIKMAMHFDQKEVVSHPIPQHVITTLVFNGIPKWRTSGICQRLVIILLLALMFPITAATTIFFPCSYIAKLARVPLIKFINGAASFVTLLVLLAIIATSDKSGLRNGTTPVPLEILLFVWILSLFMQEVSQLFSQGQREYFSSGWNWIDISMIFFMICSYFMWGIIYYTNPGHKDKSDLFFISSADGFFALAIVLSFFRMVYLCQITRFLGLLQLCLGRMLQVIFQFAFISCVVLWSFSVGMVYLFHSSAKYDEITESQALSGQNQSYIVKMLNGSYNDLPSTMVTLAWASMNMADLKSLEGLKDGTMIQLWSTFLFTLYHGVSMIVLLNMLIAMMSNSYQQIENNIEVEHKYARTNLWLEYIGDRNDLPCPFNIIPTYKKCCQYFKWMRRKLYCNTVLDESRRSRDRKASTDEYRRLCKILVERYMIKNYGVLYTENVKHVYQDTTKDDLFLSKIKLKIQTWSKVFDNSREHFAGKPLSCYTEKIERNGNINSGFHSQESLAKTNSLEDVPVHVNESDTKLDSDELPNGHVHEENRL